ncbi:MAG: hypothetical protein ACLU3N_07905 [Lachnospiraceae bacterium]
MQFVLVCAVVIAAILAVSTYGANNFEDNIGHPGKTHDHNLCVLGALAFVSV